MPYTQNYVVGTDTIQTLTTKINQTQDGIVTVQTDQNNARAAILDPIAGHKHTGIAGDGAQLGLTSLASDATNLLNKIQCMQVMEAK